MGLFGTSVNDIRKWEFQRKVDKIAKSLNTKNVEVRKAAITAFGNLRVVNGAPFLIPILNDKDSSISKLAEYAIAKIGDVAVKDLSFAKSRIQIEKKEAMVMNIGKHVFGYDDTQIKRYRDKIEAIIYKYNHGK